jgi:stress response protein YsnF
MTTPAASPPDRPFPGAHSQVPGAFARAAETPTTQSAGPSRQLVLEATLEPAGWGLDIRLPVRAEHVTITKEVVVHERVVLWRREMSEVVRLDTTVRREELRIEGQGESVVTEPRA